MADQIPKEVVQERYERLVALQDRIAAEENARLVGHEVELIVQESGGRRDNETHRLSGRARDGRLVHFDPAGAEGEIRPGDVVTVEVTEAKPYFLLADSGVRTHRRTRAGDMAAADRKPATVGLGLPGIGG